MPSNSKPTRPASLIDYPCAFPIKVMGLADAQLAQQIAAIATRFDAAFDAQSVELRPSKGGTYLGVTITVTATSREQLDALYQALTAHPLVKVVL